MKKKFDAIKMIRAIRDKSSQSYFSNKEKWLQEVSELQGKEIEPTNAKKSGRKSTKRASKSA